MSSSLEQLTILRVGQVMARDVVTVGVDDTMSAAADMLKTYGVTGLPVVDSSGRCVGVLSATDFVGWESEESHTHSPTAHFDATLAQKEVSLPEVSDETLVRAHMSATVQTIREHLSIVEAGRLMCQDHIHRLIVVDRQGRPVGIVSSLDLVSALVHGAES
ncbi:CBS domain-containing protein [Bythopirellula polymerisocia]|jgi:IMP dehydrogenase|uniref:Inosine 5'-monophosphate dehydrogenase n=1 Tax=Bythopirellula polymerisocia TaxID=2528003 RepID=A0A5C6CRD4_9BACT|nr:CBS domain-containing protein [Bythopirellula polymerisocia]TWU27473.1 inosine 5'-monophosphate dehydrogenase [Bythopirellula polymerisocia]